MKASVALIAAAVLASAATAAGPSSPPAAEGNAKYASAAASAMETIASLQSASRGRKRAGTGRGDAAAHNGYPDGLSSESALFDRETRAVYWQGGRRSDAASLASSLAGPVLGRHGAGRHVRACVLTAALWLWAWGVLARHLAGKYFEGEDGARVYRSLLALPFLTELENPVARRAAASLVRPALRFALLLVHALLHVRLPPYSPLALAAVVGLYLLESSTCSTRRYLSHSLDAPGELRAYLDGLRAAPPAVRWTVRCFHYEERPALRPVGRLLRKDADNPPPWLARKVVTHEAAARYNATSWDDRTYASAWRRAPAKTSDGDGEGPAPLGKISLTKLLVLRDRAAREDYFAQQARFVSVEGRRDVHAEFATEIDVEGFRPKVLAVRAAGGGGGGGRGLASSALFRRRMYALCVLLGLSLPYRIWFAGRCDELRVSVAKEASCAAARPDGDGEEAGGEDDGTPPGPSSSSSSSSWFRGWRSAPDPAEEGRRARELFVRTMEEHSLYSPSNSTVEAAAAVGGRDAEDR